MYGDVVVLKSEAWGNGKLKGGKGMPVVRKIGKADCQVCE
jgi:hypothetical protein